MKRKILGIMMAFCIMFGPTGSVSAAVSAAHLGYSGGAHTWELTDEYCIEAVNAVASGTSLAINAGGEAGYYFYIPFNAESITFNFAVGDIEFTVIDTEEQRSYTVVSNTAVYTLTLKPTLYIGEHKFIIKANKNKDINISKMTFNKIKIMLSEDGYQTVNLSDDEWAISTAVIIKTDASMLMVNGSRRYIDFERPTLTPIIANGTAYLPVKALARALGCYYEDLQDKQYVLIRKMDKEFVFAPDINYRQIFGKPRESIQNPVIYSDGISWVPVRIIAEFFGEKVGYSNGMIAMDDNVFYVNRILEDAIVNPYVLRKFSTFIPVQDVNSNPKTYYVSQKAANAHDANPGSQTEPWKTLEHAGQVAQAGDTVIVTEGIYRETLKVKNNGQPTKPITFKAAEGEDVVISAANNLSVGSFIPYQNGIVAAPVSVDLGLTRNQIFYKGKSLREARYPNGPGLDTAEIANLSDNWPTRGDIHVYQTKDLNHATSQTLLNQDEVDYWKGGVLVGSWATAYGLQSANIVGSKKGELTLEGGSLQFWATNVDNSVKHDFNFAYIVGNLHGLDAPGEWIIRNNTLFIIPPEGETAQTLSVDVKMRQLVIDIADNSHVNIEGFTTIGGGAKLNNSEMCRIDNCYVKYNNHFLLTADPSLGFIEDKNWKNQNGTPLRGEMGFFFGGKDNVLTNTVFDEAAGPGVYCMGLYTYMENNLVKDCGYAGGYNGGILFSTKAWEDGKTPKWGNFMYQNTAVNSGRSTFVYCAISDMRTTPVLPNEFAYNEFYGSMLTSLDTGIIYTYLTNNGYDRLPSQLHNNLVYNSYKTQPFSFGIYHDGGTQNVDTYENLVFTTADDITIPYPLWKANASLALANADMWNNVLNKVVPGGRNGLEPINYPYNKPFDAGCTLGRDEYTINYDLRHTDLTQELNSGDLLIEKDAMIPASKAVCGPGARIDKEGKVNFEGDGSWIVFRDVNFGDGANVVSLNYNADLYHLTGEDVEMMIDGLNSRVYSFANKLTTVSRQDNIGEIKNRQISGYSGYHDVYFRAKNHHALKINGISVWAHELETASRIDNRVWAGTFDKNDYVPPNPKFPCTPITYSVKDVDLIVDDSVGTYNTFGGTVLLYKNVKINEDVDRFAMSSASDATYGAQGVQVRIGDRNAAPIAELLTADAGWETFVPTTVSLNQTLPAGTYDIYIAFQDAAKSCNFKYFEFFNGSGNSPLIVGRSRPRTKCELFLLTE